jgi:predicted ferric reductase
MTADPEAPALKLALEDVKEMMSNPNPPQTNEYESSVNIQTFLVFLLACTIGLLLAILVLPNWLPNLSFSLVGSDPKAYWYLSRATAFASLSLLWLSMALGIGITNKMARTWPGAAAAFAIHEYVSLLGLAFAVFHAVVLLGDHYINFTFVQLLMPFSTVGYRPFWVGVGQVSFYVWLIVALTFYIRSLIGQKTWRFLHYLSFAMYMAGLLHGLFSGTDVNASWAQYYYWISGGSLLFLFVARVIGTMSDKLFPARPAPRQTPPPTRPAAPAARPVPGAIPSATASTNTGPKPPMSTGSTD